MNNLITASYMLDEETKEWIEMEARRLHRSASSLVRVIISGYREQQTPESNKNKEKSKLNERK